MKKNYIFSFIISLLTLLTPTIIKAQCGAGQTSLDIVIDMTNDFFPDENGWKIVNTNTGVAVDSACFTVYSTGGIQTVSVCLDTGITYSLYALDDFGDGLDGAEYRLAFTYGNGIDTIGTNNFNLAFPHCTPVYANNELADSSSFYVPYIAPPSCLVPDSLNASNFTTTSADLAWNENNAAIQWEIQYDSSGFTLGNGIDSIVNANPFSLGGLTPSTTYDFYVRSICAAGDTSAWSRIGNFSTSFQCPVGAVCATYNNGAIESDRNFTALPGTSACPGLMSVIIPAGNRLDSVTTRYNMTAYQLPNNAWMSEQRTWLYSPTTLTGEAALSLGVGTTAGTFSYERTGLVFPKDATGTIDFELHAGRTFGGIGCDAVTNSIDNNTWEIEVYYSLIPQIDIALNSIIRPIGNLCPGSFTATVAIENKGLDTIVSFDVTMDINGVATTQTVNRSIPTGDTIHVDLIPASITAGLFYDLAFYLDNPNGQIDSIPANDSLFIDSLTTGLSGMITLDTSIAISPTNFHTFSALANQLNAIGVCGNVTVDVAAATYDDVFFLDNVPGLGDSSRLTIDGGDSTLVFLENNLAGNRALVSFNDVSYVTIKNMTLRSNYLGTLAHFGVHLSNNSNYDSIINCRILMNPTNTGGAIGIGASADITNIFAQGNNANFTTVMNCAINGGDASFVFEGRLNGLFNIGNSLINNTLTNMNGAGIFVNRQDSMRIIGNNVRGMRSVDGDGIACLDHMNFEIEGNDVIAQDIGIGVLNANSFDFPDREATLINNMVIANLGSAIYLTSPSRVNIYHNTAYNEGAFPAMLLQGINLIDSLDMRNNVMYSLTDLAFEFSGNDDTLAFLRFNNNVYYTGGVGNLLDIDGTTYADLVAYQTARPSLNSNSLEGDPQFISSTDLHVVGSFIDESGDNGVNVLVDIDGDTRPSTFATFVDAGADEYTPPPCPTPTNVQALNPGLDSVTISLIGTSFDYEYEVITRGGAQGTGTIGITTTNSERIGGLNSSTSYDLYVRQVCRRGDTSPWIGPVFFSTSYGVPYLQDFENFATDIQQNPWPEGWLSTTALNPNWISYSPATGTVFRSGGTGPAVDHTVGTNAGTFIFMETSGGTVGDSADYISPPIFINDTLSTVELKYWYFNFGANIDRMEVIIDTNGVEEIIASYIGQQQTSQADQWLEAKHFLNGYQGKSIQIKFRGFNVACCTGDLAIDDVEVVIPSPTNGGVANILRPVSGCGLSNSDSVEIMIVNTGIDTISNFPVSYELSGATAVTETFNGTILSGDTAFHIFNTTVNLSTPGSYNLKSYTSIIGDGDISDDSSNIVIENIPIVSGFPYIESFESGNAGWTSGGSSSTWDLGAPANAVIDTASDGTEAWVTNLTGSYVIFEESWVQSPCLDFSTLSVPTIELDVFWVAEVGYDGAVLQSSIDGGVTWQKVGSFGDTVNWYNNAAINGLTNLEISEEGWSGRGLSGSGGWITAKHKLDGLGGISGVILRIAFGSDFSVVDEGFAFDNVFITDSLPKLDGSISSLVSPIASQDSCYSAAEDVIVTLSNTGNVPLDFTIDTARIEVNVSGALTQNLNFAVNDNSLNGGLALLGGNSIEVNLGTVNLTTAGTYNFESIINIGSDTINGNDTLLSTLIINTVTGGTLSGIDTLCVGDSTVLNTTGYQGSLQWQETISGVWTDIAGETESSITISPVNSAEYRVIACGAINSDTLQLTVINFTTGPSAVGDTTFVSCGNPGTAIASVSSTNTNSSFVWYDAQTGGSLIDTTLSTYSLNAAGNQMSYIVSSTNAGIPAVDTLWVSEIVSTGNTSCESPRSIAVVMVDCLTGLESTSTSKDELKIYPNPSNGLFNLSIYASKLTRYNLELSNLSGKIVYSNSITVNGRYIDNLDLTVLAKGAYFLQIKTSGFTEIQKLIIQ